MAMTSAAFGVASLAMTAVGTAVSVMGAIQQGQMQQQQAEQQAYMQRTQAELANLNARREAARIDEDATRLQHTQIAQAAASGVTLDSGSFLSLMADSASKAEQQRMNVLRNGALAQAQGESQANSSEYMAGLYGQAGLINAGGSLVSGVNSGLNTMNNMGWFSGPTTKAAAK